MSNQSVLMEINNGVATITLNEPLKMNVLSKSLIDGLKACLRQVKVDEEVRAVILTGTGRSFCAGGDIADFPKGITNAALGREYMKFGMDLITDLAQMEKPIIAAVNGFAVGAGFSLALACDFIFAVEESKFGMAFNKVGLVPDLGALYHLPRIVGLAKAKELVYTGRVLTAKEAKEDGIVFKLSSNIDELQQSATEFADSMAQSATQAIGLSKFILNRSFEASLEQILREEAMAQGISFTTDDHQEGVRAFIEKREPDFNGK